MQTVQDLKKKYVELCIQKGRDITFEELLLRVLLRYKCYVTNQKNKNLKSTSYRHKEELPRNENHCRGEQGHCFLRTLQIKQ